MEADPLLQALAGGDPRAMLDQLAQSDPRMALLSRILEQRNRSEPAASEAPPDIGAYAERLAELTAEVEVLRAQVRECAAALGACPRCWGQDAECFFCWGRGTPGFADPEPESFRVLVLPAVQALRARHGARQTTNRTAAGTAAGRPRRESKT